MGASVGRAVATVGVAVGLTLGAADGRRVWPALVGACEVGALVVGALVFGAVGLEVCGSSFWGGCQAPFPSCRGLWAALKCSRRSDSVTRV